MLFDAHAHIGGETDSAFIATPSTDEMDFAVRYRYKALGIIPEGREKDLEKLRIAARNGWHIGEIGLDKRFSDLPEQERIFREALRIAREYDRIAVIHTVREYGRTLDILKEEGIHGFIMHGFTGSYEIACQALSLGGMISLSPNAERAKSFEKLLALPFLIETDMKAGDAQRNALGEWSRKLSGHIGIDTGERCWKMLKDIL